MIDTDKYDNEGIELSDGGTICFPESDGCIQRIDKDGNTMQTLHPEDTEWQEWYELFDTQKDLLAEVKRLYREPRMTIDEWNTKPEGPCVTVYMNGCEYVGCLRLWKNEDGEVIE